MLQQQNSPNCYTIINLYTNLSSRITIKRPGEKKRRGGGELGIQDQPILNVSNSSCIISPYKTKYTDTKIHSVSRTAIASMLILLMHKINTDCKCHLRDKYLEKISFIEHIISLQINNSKDKAYKNPVTKSIVRSHI